MGRCIYLRKGEVHTPPVVGIKAKDLPIGQIVKLMEGGVETEFIVVNQGIPENSSLYDESCNGTWLLRKDIKEKRVWNSSVSSAYATSTVNTWLNGDYFNSLGTIEQGLIKQVKIPYALVSSIGQVKSGEEGLPVKCFLLGSCEIGITTGYTPIDGTKLTYFDSGTSTVANTKRIAYLNQTATSWWLRSINYDNSYIWSIVTDGTRDSARATDVKGIRPALILPSTSIFDPTTYLLKK